MSSKSKKDASHPDFGQDPPSGERWVELKNGNRALVILFNHPACQAAIETVRLQSFENNQKLFNRLHQKYRACFNRENQQVPAIFNRDSNGNKKAVSTLFMVLFDMLVKEWFEKHKRQDDYRVCEISDGMRAQAMNACGPAVRSNDPQMRHDKYAMYTRCGHGSGHGIRLVDPQQLAPSFEVIRRSARLGKLGAADKQSLRNRALGRCAISGHPLLNEHFCHANPLLPLGYPGNCFLAEGRKNQADKGHILRHLGADGKAIVVSDSCRKIQTKGSSTQLHHTMRALATALHASRGDIKVFDAIAVAKKDRKVDVEMMPHEKVDALIEHGLPINMAHTLFELARASKDTVAIITANRILEDVARVHIKKYGLAT